MPKTTSKVATLGFLSAARLSLDQLAQSFTEAFEDYFVPIVVDGAALASRVRQEHIDLHSSFVAMQGGQICAVCLIARRGESSRLAGMGVLRAWRGQGVGFACVEHALQQARSRQEQAVWLEVIVQNSAAHRLYERCGFQTVRRLVGYSLDASRPPTVATVAFEVALNDWNTFVLEHGDPGLPWQLSPQSLGSITGPNRAFKLDEAMALIQISDAHVLLRAIVVARESRRNGQARRLLGALGQLWPDRPWSVPAVVPDAFDGLFFAQGFVRQELAQFEMVKTL